MPRMKLLLNKKLMFLVSVALVLTALCVLILWNKKKLLEYQTINNTMETYNLGINAQFNYPKGWIVAAAGEGSGVFLDGKASSIGASSSEKMGNRHIKLSVLIRPIAEYNEPNDGAQQLRGKIVYVNQYDSYLENKYSVENQFTVINIKWTDDKYPEYYFEADCRADIDYAEILKEACFEMVKTWKVME